MRSTPPGSNHYCLLTRRLRQIRNAWHFAFKVRFSV